MSGEPNRVAVALEEWPEDAESDEGVVVNWFVREGASVTADQSLCEVQVDKVSVDVFAPVAGTLDEIVCEEDDEFEQGAPLAWIVPEE